MGKLAHALSYELQFQVAVLCGLVVSTHAPGVVAPSSILGRGFFYFFCEYTSTGT